VCTHWRNAFHIYHFSSSSFISNVQDMNELWSQYREVQEWLKIIPLLDKFYLKINKHARYHYRKKRSQEQISIIKDQKYCSGTIFSEKQNLIMQEPKKCKEVIRCRLSKNGHSNHLGTLNPWEKVPVQAPVYLAEPTSSACRTHWMNPQGRIHACRVLSLLFRASETCQFPGVYQKRESK
jgi:hypothetical protein